MNGATASYNVSEVTGNGKTIISKSPIIEYAKDQCFCFNQKHEAYEDNPIFRYENRTVVIETFHAYKNYISFDTKIDQGSGGVHPYHDIERRTFNGITGKTVSLKDIFGEKITLQALIIVRREFERSYRNEISRQPKSKKDYSFYQWDPKSFSFKKGDKGKNLVEFLFDTNVYVAAGEAIMVEYDVKTGEVKSRIEDRDP